MTESGRKSAHCALGGYFRDAARLIMRTGERKTKIDAVIEMILWKRIVEEDTMQCLGL